VPPPAPDDNTVTDGDVQIDRFHPNPVAAPTDWPRVCSTSCGDGRPGPGSPTPLTPVVGALVSLFGLVRAIPHGSHDSGTGDIRNRQFPN